LARESKQSIYTSTPQRCLVSLGSLQLNVLDWGGNSNRTLIFLHGLASSSHMFDLIAQELTTRYHVYAPDQRGHGLSDKPSTGYEFDNIAFDLDMLLTVLNPSGEPVALVGHSWGAYTTLYYAATRPDKVSRAVLLDGGIARIADQYPTWEDAEKGMSPPTYKNRSLEDIQRMIEKDWLGPIFRPELASLALSVFDTGNPSDVRARLSRANHMQIASALRSFDPADYYSSITCPILIVNAVPPGQPVSPKSQDYAQQAASRIGQVEIIWMHDTAHDIPWHRPQALTEILNHFL
jgi:pimeloyl-ACP methyl ester carboxylesterase